MRTVILAAGIGSRLNPITIEVPKCMVEVNGIKIIDRQIQNLYMNEIKDIAVITGYKSEILQDYINKRYPFVQCIENRRYLETNNMYSLFLAKDYIKDCDFLLMNADVYFDANIITGMLRQPDKNIIACDTNQYLVESMKITVEKSIKHISKLISKEEYYAISIDIYKISAEAGRTLFKEITETIMEKKNKNLWTEVAIDKILDKEVFMPHIIKGRWLEIDDHDDLAQASVIFKGDTL